MQAYYRYHSIYNYREQIKYFIEFTKIFIKNTAEKNIYIYYKPKKLTIVFHIIAHCRSPGLLL